MNIPENDDEASSNSSRKEENGDATVETERPLKKARFAWQVKGKYHLKNETSESKTIPITNETSNASSSSENESDTSEVTVNTEQNLEILGDYLLKQDLNTLESIAETDESLPNTSLPTENLSHPKYVSSCSSKNENSTNKDSNNTSRPSVNNSLNYTEDEDILRWQTRQMAKCYIDNTINRVLDNWMVTPVPVQDSEDRTICLDVAEFLNSYQVHHNNPVENEGILMAISAHGLQTTSNSSNDSINSNSDTSCSRDLSTPDSPFSDDYGHIPNFRNKEDQVESTSNDMDMSWLCLDNMEQPVNNEPTEACLPEASSSSMQTFNDNVENRNEYRQEDDSNDTVNTHYDFMDAAVGYAIQYKGLTSLGTDG